MRDRGAVLAMAAVLVVTGGTSRADPADSAWSEYALAEPAQPLSQLTEAACDVDVSLRGAIAEVEMRQRLANPGPALLAATSVLELPHGAQLVEVAAQPDRKKAERSIMVGAAITSDTITSDAVLGADPLLATALTPLDGHPRYRLILQPIEPEHGTTITTRWIVAAELRDGQIRVTLPAHPGLPCRGLLQVTPGPGTSVAHIRYDGVDTGVRSFQLADTDVTIGVELAFKRAEPVVWTQTESIGDRPQGARDHRRDAGRTSRRRPPRAARDRQLAQHGARRPPQRQEARARARRRAAEGSELEAIFYDRTATRAFGAWKPVAADNLAALDKTIDNRTAGNGSDTAAAFALAKTVVDESAREGRS